MELLFSSSVPSRSLRPFCRSTFVQRTFVTLMIGYSLVGGVEGGRPMNYDGSPMSDQQIENAEKTAECCRICVGLLLLGVFFLFSHSPSIVAFVTPC